MQITLNGDQLLNLYPEYCRDENYLYYKDTLVTDVFDGGNQICITLKNVKGIDSFSRHEDIKFKFVSQTDMLRKEGLEDIN